MNSQEETGTQMSETEKQMAELLKQMEALKNKDTEEKKEALKKSREAKKKEFVSKKYTAKEYKELLGRLWDLENPEEKPKEAKKEKAKRKPKEKAEDFGFCICRGWGNGFGCPCGAKATSSEGYCKRHTKELEEYGGISLGYHEEPRPETWECGKIPKGREGKKIWKNSPEEKKEEAKVEDLGA